MITCLHRGTAVTGMKRGDALRRVSSALAFVALVFGLTGPSVAADVSLTPPVKAPAGSGSYSPRWEEASDSFWSDLWTRDTFLGDIGGLRTRLAQLGVTFNLQEQSEVFSNVSGGIHTGADYKGLTTMSVGLDTDKAFHWPGGTFFASALQIHGRDISSDNLGVLQTVSNLEAKDTTRLWELWYQQAFWNGKADIKIGQQSLDREFIVSHYADLYLNAMMGWPMLPTADLYAGGPAYPLSSVGVRLRAHISPALTLLAGVFDDNPPGGPFNDDSQLRDAEASGTRFNLDTGALWIAELQYAANASPAKDCDSVICGLPGTYKLGAWYDTADFPDRQFDMLGLSLANPLSNGIARNDRGNFSVYGVADQMLWREAGGPRSIGVFVRAMAAPSDRNLIDFSLNAGVNVKAPFPGRQHDTFGIGYDFAHVGNAASVLDRDIGVFTGTAYPVRSAEHVIEVTYQYQVAPWWVLQPDFQYVINPGGGILDPNNKTQEIANEAIFGLRTTVTF